MAADDSGTPHAAPAAGFAASPASHRPPRPDDASSDVVRAVVGARAERQALLDALDAERTQRAQAERERDHALQRVSELEAQVLENDEDLERTFHQLQVITKAETARAEKAAADLRRERALASAALLRESDAELERRMSSTSPPESAQHSPRQAAPAPAFGFDSSPFGDDKSTAAAVSETESNGGAEAAVQALASKLLEQRRARARASAERFAQQAHHKTDEFAVFASAAAAAAADTTLSLSEALQVAETTPPQAAPEALPLRSMGPRRSSSAGQLSSNGGSPGLLALPPPSGWQAFASTPPAHTPPASLFPGWVQF